MKKILYLLALSFAALSVGSCGKNSKLTASDADEPDTPVWKMPTGQVELGTTDLEYPDYDWLVLMSVPQFTEGSSIDICTKGQMSAPTNTFHGLQLGGKVAAKEVKNTLLLDRPFIKIRGGHPFFYKHVSKGAA